MLPSNRIPPAGNVVRLVLVGRKGVPDSFGGVFRLSGKHSLEFLENLGVPVIWISGAAYFWLFTFEMCLAAVLAPGGPGFVAPINRGQDKRPGMTKMPKRLLLELAEADPKNLLMMEVSSVIYGAMDKATVTKRLDMMYQALAKGWAKTRQDSSRRIAPSEPEGRTQSLREAGKVTGRPGKNGPGGPLW